MPATGAVGALGSAQFGSQGPAAAEGAHRQWRLSCAHTHTHTLPHMSAGRYKCVQRHKHCWGNMCTPRKGWQQTQPSDLGHGRFSQLQLAQIRLTWEESSDPLLPLCHRRQLCHKLYGSLRVPTLQLSCFPASQGAASFLQQNKHTLVQHLHTLHVCHFEALLRFSWSLQYSWMLSLQGRRQELLVQI